MTNKINQKPYRVSEQVTLQIFFFGMLRVSIFFRNQCKEVLS